MEPIYPIYNAPMNQAPQTFTGTKTVIAEPMTREAYNTYRGWVVPSDENPADEGYLVEYTDGGKANMPDRAGYVSWSPKDVFERSYKATSEQITGEAAIEAVIQAKGLNAPRLSPEELDRNIIHSAFVKHVSAGGQVLRWCVLTTKSGFAVTGRPSVSVSPENDDQEIGERVAFANARAELWPLMGYALKERLKK